VCIGELETDGSEEDCTSDAWRIRDFNAKRDSQEVYSLRQSVGEYFMPRTEKAWICQILYLLGFVGCVRRTQFHAIQAAMSLVQSLTNGFVAPFK
jgi:hypothetical protein